METEEERSGKAYVHWKSWHETYPGFVSSDYLAKVTLEKCEETARLWPDNILVAKDGERVIGFVGYGVSREEGPPAGEIFAIYILKEYYGTGVGQRLMEEGMKRLPDYPTVRLWVLKDNRRAVRFYEKMGFVPDGMEKDYPSLRATGIRMSLTRTVE
ncbi:MAG: GNAT family N-acetyltransferase [Clostridia bacterium]|nr:GNAT family N-acetyltransferase [Clostridia bacterium]